MKRYIALLLNIFFASLLIISTISAAEDDPFRSVREEVSTSAEQDLEAMARALGVDADQEIAYFVRDPPTTVRSTNRTQRNDSIDRNRTGWNQSSEEAVISSTGDFGKIAGFGAGGLVLFVIVIALAMRKRGGGLERDFQKIGRAVDPALRRTVKEHGMIQTIRSLIEQKRAQVATLERCAPAYDQYQQELRRVHDSIDRKLRNLFGKNPQFSWLQGSSPLDELLKADEKKFEEAMEWAKKFNDILTAKELEEIYHIRSVQNGNNYFLARKTVSHVLGLNEKLAEIFNSIRKLEIKTDHIMEHVPGLNTLLDRYFTKDNEQMVREFETYAKDHPQLLGSIHELKEMRKRLRSIDPQQNAERVRSLLQEMYGKVVRHYTEILSRQNTILQFRELDEKGMGRAVVEIKRLHAHEEHFYTLLENNVTLREHLLKNMSRAATQEQSLAKRELELERGFRKSVAHA